MCRYTHTSQSEQGRSKGNLSGERAHQIGRLMSKNVTPLTILPTDNRFVILEVNFVEGDNFSYLISAIFTPKNGLKIR